MKRNFDVIVIGLGGMGSAALYELAGRGVSVLGIEQFDIGHNRGSSHGETRLIRRAYFEHPDYVPLVDAAYRGWSDLTTAGGHRLFVKTGLYLADAPDGDLITGTRLAAKRHNLPIESLTVDEARDRFPALVPDDGMAILYEPDAGFLYGEECVRTFVTQARLTGAEVLANTPVRSWRPDGDGLMVETDAGTFHGARLIVCAGAWAARLLADLQLPLTVLRRVSLWYEIENDALTLERGLPIFGFGFGSEGGFLYGFPSIDGRTVELGEHTEAPDSNRAGAPRGGGETPSPAPAAASVDPDRLDRTLHPKDEDRILRFATRHVTGVSRKLARHSVCMYTMSPDGHFIVDRHPSVGGVVFAAGFSGHGFKFAPVIGSALADLATGKEPPPAMSFLTLDRLARREPHPR